jgi:uncharacterized protein YmfQ (DUF2313 family)
MKTFQVYVSSQQEWTYVYHIKAKTEEDAIKRGMSSHEQGNQPLDSWVDGEVSHCFQTIEGTL